MTLLILDTESQFDVVVPVIDCLIVTLNTFFEREY